MTFNMRRLNEKETQLVEKDKHLKAKQIQIHKRKEQTNRTELEYKNQAQRNAALKSLVIEMKREMMLEIKEENRLLKIQVLSAGNYINHITTAKKQWLLQ